MQAVSLGSILMLRSLVQSLFIVVERGQEGRNEEISEHRNRIRVEAESGAVVEVEVSGESARESRREEHEIGVDGRKWKDDWRHDED